MKKYFSTGIITIVAVLSMCCLSSSFVIAESWDESVEYCIDEEVEASETYEEDGVYSADENESDEWDESYDEEEYSSDDEISDDSEEPDNEYVDSINESKDEVPDVPVLEETVSGDEDVLSTTEYAMLEDTDGDIVASGTCGDMATWTLTGEEPNLTLTISGSGDMRNFREYDAPWSSERSKIKTVIVEEGITGVGNYAFYGCKMTDITLPDSVTSIGRGAFRYCRSLSSITIPFGVTTIEEYTFSNCSSLTSVTLPNSVTSIRGYELIPYDYYSYESESGAFYGCSSLTSITIPDSVTSIGCYVFCNCTSLTSIAIPYGVTTIKACTFFGCSSLTNVTIPDSVTRIEGCPFYDDEYSRSFGAFQSCRSLTSITIPDSVMFIGSSVFFGCSSLTNVTIPDSVTSIEDYTFCGCTRLTSITISDSVTSIGAGAFSGCSSLTNVTIPDSVTRIEGCPFDEAEFRYLDNDPSDGAFYGCISLTSITIPDSVTSIESCVFYGCSSLTSITIPDSVTTIREYAFSGCSNLTSITIPDSMTAIEGDAFDGCSKLTIVGNIDSYAEEYAENNDIPFMSCEEFNKTSLKDAEIRGLSDKIYTGNAFEPKPVVKLNGKILVLNQDYYLAYKYNINASESEAKRATVAVKGMGNYKDVAVARFWIKPASLSSADITGITDKIYTGNAFEPKPIVMLDGKALVLGQDYYLAYKYNINASESEAKRATVAVKGMGNYKDVAVARFWIKPASLSSAEITGITDKIYTGNAFEPKPVVKLDGKTLVLDKDYYLAYKYNTNVSESEGKRATVAVKGMGNYCEVAVARFWIRASLSSAVISGITDKTYTGQAIEPKPVVKLDGKTLVLNRDYYLAYKYNINASENEEKRATVAVKGMGKYTGVAVARFWIRPASLSEASISELYDKTYTGNAIEPKPVARLYGWFDGEWKWKTLKLGTDYTLAYKYNTNASESYEKRATVAVKGKGNYKGTAVARFWINRASIEDATITGITSKVYTGQELTQAPVVKVGGRTLKLNTDYSLKYFNNTFPGEARIEIRGKGNYNGYVEKSFAINPMSVSTFYLASPKTKQIRIRWHEPLYYAKYQIEISSSKDFSNPEIRKNTSGLSYSEYDYLEQTLNVAKSNTTYYVRMRAVVQTSKNYFSTWSPVKTVKTK